jgi:vacuolar-type H+-ATPase subunit I/STV1
MAPIELVAILVGVLMVLVGLWFYFGRGWTDRRVDFFLSWMFMAIPLGVSFVLLAIAHSRIFGPLSWPLAYVGLGAMVISWVAAYIQPRRIAPSWLRRRGYKQGPAGPRPRWPIWLLFGITFAVVLVAVLIQSAK